MISHIAAGNFTQNADDSCQVGGTTGLSRCVAVCQYRIWDSEVPYSLILSAVLTRSHMHARWKSPVSQFQCSFLLSVALHRVPWRWSGQSAFTKTGASGNDLSWEWCAFVHTRVCGCVCVFEYSCHRECTFWPHVLALTSKKQKHQELELDYRWKVNREKKIFFWLIVNLCSVPSLQTCQHFPMGATLCDCVVLKSSNIISSHFSIYVL